MPRGRSSLFLGRHVLTSQCCRAEKICAQPRGAEVEPGGGSIIAAPASHSYNDLFLVYGVKEMIAGGPRYSRP